MAWRRRTASRRRAGSVAVEFALIAVAFLGLLMFTLELGFRLYTQIALDYATARAARLLEVNSTQQLSASGATGFQTFCPLLAPLLNCAGALIGLRAVGTDYLTDSRATPTTLSGTLTQPAYSAGQSGSLMLLQVTYIGPALTWPFSAGQTATYNGVAGSAIVSSVPYANDY